MIDSVNNMKDKPQNERKYFGKHVKEFISKINIFLKNGTFKNKKTTNLENGRISRTEKK